ncbi:LysE family translocator [Leptobacterium sp. I13]|uniref:LysE family translocator n=1 Tax=Leptobacterium meishanense TaxID=3128904 RepID=UPI0030EF9C48
MNYETLLSFLIASMALTISPGPDIIYVLMQGVVNGRKHGVVTALGLVSGILIHTTLVAFGISVLIKESTTAYFIIKLFGAGYLFYLAYKVYKSDVLLSLTKDKVLKRSLTGLFKQGFMMNVLNPKVTLFFLAFFPGFLFSNEVSTITQFYILGGIFMLQAFIIFGLVAVMAGVISNYIKHHTQIGVVLKWTQVMVFIGIGIFILLP